MGSGTRGAGRFSVWKREVEKPPGPTVRSVSVGPRYPLAVLTSFVPLSSTSETGVTAAGLPEKHTPAPAETSSVSVVVEGPSLSQTSGPLLVVTDHQDGPGLASGKDPSHLRKVDRVFLRHRLRERRISRATRNDRNGCINYAEN